MIKLSKEQLEERLYSDYKEVLMKLFIEKPIAAEMLAMEMIQLNLHWWPIRNYEPSKDFEDMWRKQLKDKLIIDRDYDSRSIVNIQTYWAKITFKSSWNTTFSISSKMLRFIFMTSPLYNILNNPNGDTNFWLNNGLEIWINIANKIGIKMERDSDNEYQRKLTEEIFVSPYTEFIRIFQITIGETINIHIFYELNFMTLDNTYLAITDDIEISLPCVERHLEAILRIFVDFDRDYLIYPEETLEIYGLIEDVDDYIDNKLKRGIPPHEQKLIITQ
jgi:hypothetical protein